MESAGFIVVDRRVHSPTTSSPELGNVDLAPACARPPVPGYISRVRLACLPFMAQHPNSRPSPDAARHLGSYLNRTVEERLCGLLDLP